MAADTGALSLADVRAAADRIAPYVLKTPTLSGESVAGPGVWLKAENLQRTGSFKLRGALARALALDAGGPGLTTGSAGNHAAALAWAARALGLSCEVFMPTSAPIAKAEAAAALEAVVRLGGESVDECVAVARERAAETGMTFVHPFDDPLVVAGQGGVGLELVEDVPDLARVVVPLGGGGLIAGMAVAIKAQRPKLRIIGVEPEGAPVVSESLAAGQPVAPSRLDSIADGLGAPYTRPFNLGLVQRYVDQMRTVSDAAIIEAVKAITQQAKLVVEPAGAAAVAALLADAEIERPVAAVLSGGNVDMDRLASWLSR